MERRELLKNIGLAAGTIAVSGGGVSAAFAEPKQKKKRVFRIAHITDVHIRPEYDAPNRFRKNAGSLDEEQRNWLEKDFAKLPAGTAVICLSHYPILSVSTIIDGGNHTDSKYITSLFYKHRDKKISCLSGHIHLQDSAEYNGVNYFCNGALSGFWWEDGDKESAGKYYYKQTSPGYAILDLYEDGTVHNQYFPHSF